MAEKQKRVNVTSPRGVIKFSHIHKPNTRFVEGGEYSCDLLLDPDANGVAEFKSRLEKAAADAKAEFLKNAKDGKTRKAIEGYAVYVPISADVDNESGDETGKLLLKVKNKATFVSKKDGSTQEKRILVFDAAGKPAKGLKIGRGSEVKVSFVIAPFCNAATKSVGVTLWFEAVQVLKLVEFGGGEDAGRFGFGAEDGFTASDDQSDDETTDEQSDEQSTEGSEGGEGGDF